MPKLDIEALKRAVTKAGLMFTRDTKGTIKTRKIWDTGDLWGSIQMGGNAEKDGTIISVVIGANSAELGFRRRSRVNYARFVHDGARYANRSLIPRPFFTWTMEKNRKDYNKAIMDRYKLITEKK